MSRLVAVGDIHGCADTLRLLLGRLQLESGDCLLTIGDLSSKGCDSFRVHQQLVELETRGIEVLPLLGNHELMLIAMQQFIGAPINVSELTKQLLHDAEIEFFIRQNGTWATLKSYGFHGVDDPKLWAFPRSHPRRHFEVIADRLLELDWQLPVEHLALLSKCRTHHIARNCVFVHAGFAPAILAEPNVQDAVRIQLETLPRDICWNRDWLGTKPRFPELLIHGHTPLSYLYSHLPSTDPWKDQDLIFKSVIHAGALNLDSGVCLESGHLTTAEIPENGNTAEIEFLRVPRVDPVEKDRLWYMQHV